MRRNAVGPADRFRIGVVARDVAPDLPRQVWDRREDPPGEQVSLDLRKPEFDLVEPRRVVGVKCKWTGGWVAKKTSTSFVLRVERLSAMTWISRRRGWDATTSARNSTKAALVCRGTVCPTILPVRVLSAANIESVPCR